MENALIDIQKKLACVMAYINKNDFVASDMLLSDYLKMWYEKYRYKKVAYTTYSKDYNNIYNQIIPKLGQERLSNLNPLMLQDFLNGVERPRQRQHLAILLKHALRQAVELELIAKNPMIGVIVPSYEKKETPVFSREQQERFFCVAKDYYKYYDIFMILCNEGLRPCEVRALCGEDISENEIIINKAMDTGNHLKSTKTKAGIRAVPIFNTVKDIFQKYKDISGRVFNVSLKSLEENFQDICNKAGLSGFKLYSLRHTFITRCAEKNVHPKIVQKWAGHKSLNMTLKFYTHISQEWEIEQIKKINDNNFF